MVFLEVTIIVFLIIALAFCINGLYQKFTNGICKNKRRLDGKTALITGGTTGLGLEIAMDFAARGARVIIACPFKEEGTNAENNIKRTTGNSDVSFQTLDLKSFASVREFAGDILESEKRLDILVNNAGIGVDRSKTKDGLHSVMKVNYFSHFLLTQLLLPLLEKTGERDQPSRITNISSGLHKIASLDINNLNRSGYFFPIVVYGNSKLCMILFTRELHKRLKDKHVVVNSVEPGAVATTIFDQFGWPIGKIITFILKYTVKTIREGVQTTIHATLSNKCLVGGQHFRDCEVYPPKLGGNSDDDESKLWSETLKLIELSEDRCLNK